MKISHPITKNPIITLEDWRSFANPSHWVDGYSAKETAKFWLMQKEIPLEIFKRLNQIETMESIVFENLIPELQTTFDQYSNGRNHDMGVFAKAGNKKIFIGIESKVAEPFDNKTLGQYLNLGLMDRWLGIFTKKPDRAEGLFSMFKDFKRIANIFDIKYQLLQSTAGIIAEAHKKLRYGSFFSSSV